MAKDKSEKKEKKESRRSSTGEGVTKAKKEKKDKKSSRKSDVTEALTAELENQQQVAKTVDADGDVEMDGQQQQQEEEVATPVVTGALVPFANPLADEKEAKKVMKGVKKAAKSKTLKRGVKEVVKALRKSPTAAPASSNPASPLGVVVIAADISPMDVIAHLPVLCEDHNIPYIYVRSRAELGAAGNTKRPTSVVMLARDRSAKAKADQPEAEEEWKEAFADVVKVVQKASGRVKV